MRPAAWLEDLQGLAARLVGLGIGPDPAALIQAAAWGLYRFLAWLAAGGADV